MDSTTIHQPIQAALIWLDRSHAYVARPRGGETAVTEVDRDVDREDQFLLRLAHETADCERVLVTGDDASRVAFEREYVAIYRRPDRLIDGGDEAEPAPRELADRLRFITALVDGV
jgi:hypothetical protein